MNKISKIYSWLVKHIPTQLLHVFIPFLIVMIGSIFSLSMSIGLAIGASLGRESVRIPQLSNKVIRDDTLRDLIFDAVGIGIGLIVNLLV